jgi:hypothetical protein
LIVLAVVVFLLVDAAIVFLVIGSRRTADDYGRSPFPARPPSPCRPGSSS